MCSPASYPPGSGDRGGPLICIPVAGRALHMASSRRCPTRILEIYEIYRIIDFYCATDRQIFAVDL